MPVQDRMGYRMYPYRVEIFPAAPVRFWYRRIPWRIRMLPPTPFLPKP